MPSHVYPQPLSRGLSAAETAAAGVACGFPRAVLGYTSGGDLTVYYDGDELPEGATEFATLWAALEAAASSPPPIPTLPVAATTVPSPGLVLDLGTGDQRFGTLFCQTVNQVSDARLKADVAALPAPLGLGLVRALRPVGFRYAGGRRTHLGFLAQDVRAALAAAAPGADLAVWCSTPVAADPKATGLPAGMTEVESLRPDQLLAPLVAAAQELDARTAALEAAAPGAPAQPSAEQLAAALATAAAAEATAAAAAAEAAALHAQVGRLQAQIDALRDAVDSLAKLNTAMAGANL